jgi:hypothetical protein
MRTKTITLFFFTLLILTIHGCEKSDTENASDNGHIDFTLVGKLEGEKINYSTRFSTVRDSFYSYVVQSESKYIEFARYSPDFESYIEMCVTMDSLNHFNNKEILFNALNYSIDIEMSQKTYHIKLESYIIISLDTTYTTPFNYSNIELDNDNNRITGNFSYSTDSLKNSSTYYTIFGQFDINLKN